MSPNNHSIPSFIRRFEEVLMRVLCELAKIKSIKIENTQDTRALLTNNALLPSNSDVIEIEKVLNKSFHLLEIEKHELESMFKAGLNLFKGLESSHKIVSCDEV